MKLQRIYRKLELNKNTVANLNPRQLDDVRGGTDTFTEPQWFTCDLTACRTKTPTCGNTCNCPNPSGKPYCYLCEFSDPISGCAR